ncbi:MAG: M16 family metallopeptidase [Gemmatimonadaceae bacterium]
MPQPPRSTTPGAPSRAGADSPVRRATLVAIGSAALLLAARLVGAQQPASSPPAPQQQGATIVVATPATAYTRGASVEGITEYVFANGLRVLLFPDQSKPTVTVNVTYLAGSRHEGYGESGMAHLFEHMLFKGTPRHPKIPTEIEARGSRYNANTSFDRTVYFQTLPAADSNLVWALDLEADRMVNTVLERKDLEAEFPVVRNEFESGENSPFLVTAKRVLGSAYLHHAYGHLPIGAQSDIENVSIDRMRAFYAKYYQPDNAVVMVAGKFDELRAIQIIQDKFGRLPRPARALEPTYTVEPPQDGERTATVRRAGTEQLVAAYYKVPAGAHGDFAAIDVLDQVMRSAPAGRLHKALVEAGKAASIGGLKLQQRDPGGIFWIAHLRVSDSLNAARDAFLKAVDQIVARAPSGAEVDRAKTTLLKNIELSLAKSDQIGLDMSEWIAMGDWRLFFLQRDRIERVTPADVQRVAAAYLKPSNRTLGFFIPTTSPDRAVIPTLGPADVAAMVGSYKGRGVGAAGESFDAAPANIDARTRRGRFADGVKFALLSKKTRGETVNAVVTLRFGDERVMTGRAHVADPVAQMLLRGTTTKTRQQLRDELDRLKARVTVTTVGPMAIRASVETTRPNFAAALASAAEVLRAPAFDAKEFEEMRRARIAQLEAQRSEPIVAGQLAYLRVTTPYPKGHPRYIASPDEQLALLKALTVEDARKFHADFYGASAGEVAIVGDFDANAAVDQLGKLFAGWRSKTPFAPVPAVHTPVPATRQTVETPDKPNAFLIAGHTFAMRDSDADYPAMELANYLLGGGMLGSRLVARVRTKESLSYTAGSALAVQTQDRFGQFIAMAIQAPANADKVERAFVEEIERAIRDGFTPEEVAQGKSGYLQARQVARSQDAQLANALAAGLLHDRTMAWDAELEAKIQALTPEQLTAALRRTIDPRKLTIVRAGNFAKVTQAGQPGPAPTPKP